MIVKETGLSNVQTGFVAIIPYVFGLMGMLALGRMADKPGARLATNYLALTISIIGLLGAGYFDEPVLRLVFLCGAAIGFLARCRFSGASFTVSFRIGSGGQHCAYQLSGQHVQRDQPMGHRHHSR